MTEKNYLRSRVVTKEPAEEIIVSESVSALSSTHSLNAERNEKEMSGDDRETYLHYVRREINMTERAEVVESPRNKLYPAII